jgi:hypothetical protein
MGTQQTIATPDGQLHHQVPVTYFRRLVGRWRLRQYGPGARDVTGIDLSARRRAAERDWKDAT